ncbi:lipopolysaccharide biosynthesis protein [Rossellomorea vietnamensis]|uniref:Flippase n=1 Tax=Rossellomorea vietnamensis TaxID=218284 RepID=A0A0P6VZ71_9BACI|nr:flippase [Rossellomorea vietnamensis]KPL58244.1 flippase [Rossellomorea vietnamensis]
MRTKHSIFNITAGLANQLIITSLSFISRTIFIGALGIEYLGVQGLFTNIFAMLSLAEAGIGSSIIYSLYKPVADHNIARINALMRLYKNAYLAIAVVILILGLVLFPFLPLFLKDSSVDHINIIYLIFLLNTVAPYLFQYKISFLNVNQKNYVVTLIYSASSIITMCLKIGILYYTKNFILFLIVESIITISTSIILAGLVNKKYPFLKSKEVTKLDASTKKGIIKNIKAIILQNVGVFLVLSTDNIIISSFVGIAAVGLYSNYSMLIEICRNFSYQISNNIHHSVGNLVATESKEKIYSIFKVSLFSNFWLYSFSSIFMYVVIEPFITLWIGKEFLMGKTILIILLLIFFERGMRNSITMVKNTAGIYHEDRFAPLIQAAINLGTSLILVKFIGITGVFLGTLISVISVPLWLTPLLVYRKVFQVPFFKYWGIYFLYFGIALMTCFITESFCKYVIPNGNLNFLLKVTTCLLLPNIIFLVLFFRTQEFRYLVSVGGIVVEKLYKRVKVISRLRRDASV